MCGPRVRDAVEVPVECVAFFATTITPPAVAATAVAVETPVVVVVGEERPTTSFSLTSLRGGDFNRKACREVVTGDVRPGDVRPGDVRPGDVRPGDVRPGDVRPGDVTRS